jgi:hypothetical protein
LCKFKGRRSNAKLGVATTAFGIFKSIDYQLVMDLKNSQNKGITFFYYLKNGN